MLLPQLRERLFLVRGWRDFGDRQWILEFEFGFLELRGEMRLQVTRLWCPMR
jgi:hypothetical protein